MGIPRACRGNQEVRLRSKKTRAVLASLLLPERFSFPVPAALSRQTLAERFWGDKDNPRVHLRQALDSLRTQFGSHCFEADQDTIRAVPGAFITDLDTIREIYQKARHAPPEERLQYLIEAEGNISGPFLDACLKTGEPGEEWIHSRRAEVHSWVGFLLLALADAFEEAGNLNGALVATQRAVMFQPESASAQERLWRLAEQTGQEAVLPTLEHSSTFEEAIERLNTQETPHLTGEETRLFHALYKAKRSTLPVHLQQALPRLAVLPAPFSANMSLKVTRVSSRTLQLLARTPFVHQMGDEFTLPQVIRACAWRPVPSTTKHQLAKQLAFFCSTWLKQAAVCPPPALPPPFARIAQAEPFLCATLHWHLKQPPTLARIEFINSLHTLGLLNLAAKTLPYLDQISTEESYPLLLRYVAGHTAGHISFSQNDFPAAILRFERILGFMAMAQDRIGDAALVHFLLGNVYHYAGDSQTAVTHLQKARVLSEQEGAFRVRADCLRVLCEIQNHLGDFEEALRVGEEALSIRRVLLPRSKSVADALFWKGATLFRLNRLSESAQCIEEALSLWQDTHDKTGIGFCLRLLGRLRAEQGCFAEARAHLDHAILLHEQMGDSGSRIAAVEARADVFLREGRPREALPLYEECLADRQARQHQKGIERLQSRIQNCQLSV